jgi:hypothetical protein
VNRSFGWLALFVFACGRDVELGRDAARRDGGLEQSDDSGVDAAVPPCQVTDCDGKILACGDCVDNDGDQLIDRQDPECLGACDDTEDSYYSGILGKSDATCKLDCYFDGDNGSGNDDCHWSVQCDPLSQAPDYPPSGDGRCAYDRFAAVPGSDQTCDQLRVFQSADCQAACLPLTPAGCDCFGCCELPRGSARYVWLGSSVDGIGSCDASGLSDPSRCRPCTQVSGCVR